MMIVWQTVCLFLDLPGFMMMMIVWQTVCLFLDIPGGIWGEIFGGDDTNVRSRRSKVNAGQNGGWPFHLSWNSGDIYLCEKLNCGCVPLFMWNVTFKKMIWIFTFIRLCDWKIQNWHNIFNCPAPAKQVNRQMKTFRNETVVVWQTGSDAKLH